MRYSSRCGCAAKKPKVGCRSVCRRSTSSSAVSCGAALAPSRTCCPGRHGGVDTGTAPSSATTEDGNVCSQFTCIYGRSTKSDQSPASFDQRFIAWLKAEVFLYPSLAAISLVDLFSERYREAISRRTKSCKALKDVPISFNLRCKLRGDIPSFPVSLTTSWHVGLSYIIPNSRPTRSAGTQCDNSNSRFSHALLDISNSIEWASGSLMSSKSASNSKKFSSVSNVTSQSNISEYTLA